jgi:hypothetical protein
MNSFTRPSRGQSMIEYLIVLTLVGISLTAGPRSPLEQLVGAIGQHYSRLTDAVSQP